MTMPIAGIAAATLVALAGCSAVPEPHNLRLDAPFAVAPALRSLDGDLQVESFTARGLLGDRRLAYVDADAPGELRQSATLFWEEPPADAAAIVTAAVLRAAHAAPVVTGVASRGLAEYWLSARLDRFEYVRSRSGGSAVVDVEFTLTRAGDHRVLMVMSACAATPVAGDERNLAVAFDDAMGRVLADLVPDLTRRGAAAAGAPDSGARRGPGC